MIPTSGIRAFAPAVRLMVLVCVFTAVASAALAQTVAVVRPNGGEKVYAADSYLIEWTASAAATAIVSFDVGYSTDGGVTFTAIPECTALPGSARSCMWTAPGPASSAARVRVTAATASGSQVRDSSNGSFTVLPGSGSIAVTAPNTAVSWGVGSVQTIRWLHTLGSYAVFALDASRDGGVTWSPIADGVRGRLFSPAVSVDRSDVVRVECVRRPGRASCVRLTADHPAATKAMANGVLMEPSLKQKRAV